MGRSAKPAVRLIGCVLLAPHGSFTGMKSKATIAIASPGPSLAAALALFSLAAVARNVDQPVTFKIIAVRTYDENNQPCEPIFDYWPITDDDLETYDFIVAEDIADTMVSFRATRKRLVTRGADVKFTSLVNKQTSRRIPGFKPDSAPLQAEEGEWIVGEGMNTGNSVQGLQTRCTQGIWVMQK